jgi:hypothetical protein
MVEIGERIEQANAEVIARMFSARPVLVDLQRALDVVPGMTRTTVLHAGPPIEWARMCGPMRGGVIGALIYEGLAADAAEAERLAASGAIDFSPCHHHGAVGPMAGIISASMPVYVVENRTHGNRSYATQNEGLGKVLRYGAYDEGVIGRLKWMEQTLAPTFRMAIRQSEGIDLKSIIAQALQMGDECHNRNAASGLLLLREIALRLATTDAGKEATQEVLRFVAGNPLFFLNLSMAACKATMDAAHGVAYSTVVTAMARNGVEIGIRVSGLGDRWFTAPAPRVEGLYFAGFSAQDANPDLGDSTITETAGIGGFAMAAAPAIVQFVGGNYARALAITRSMAEITVAKNASYQIPALDFEGSPTGIDVRKVVETGIAPAINTGIAHREPGVGQVGAGLTAAPLEMFAQALLAMGEEWSA